MIKNLILKNRSYRRFCQKSVIKKKTLKELVDLGRISSSAANLQPLKYILSYNPEKNALIFPHLRWAGYIKDWPGPKEGERPSAYIIILGDTKIAKAFGCDHGIAAENILLGAVEKKLGGCMLGAIDRKGLRKGLKISDRYEILLVLALGKPKEKVVLEIAKRRETLKYWRDKKGRHHVPKRRLEEVIVG